MALPEESQLNDKPVKSDREGYFKLILSDLKPSTTYPLQFRWQYQDGSFGPWSLTKLLVTPSFENLLEPSDPVFEGIPGAIKCTWDGKDASGNLMTSRKDFDRVDIHIAGTSFGDGTKPADNFKLAGTKTFKCEPGIYFGQLKGYRKDGTSSFFSNSVTVTVPPQEQEVQPPVAPKGFTSERVLGGIEVAWDGTYVGGAEWYGFEAINIYAGTSINATPGTYIKVGQMTANKTNNKIVVPMDGTYVKYDNPVYFHASSLNKLQVESSIVANVTRQLFGARSAISSDLADQIITNEKIVNDAVSAAKIATGAITEVKIDNNAITAAKIAAGAITEVKIDNSAITAAKIAAGAITETKIDNNAITAAKIAAGAITETKIAADAITAPKIAAGAIEAGKIAAGAITAEKIAANAIDADKIAANAITAAKIAAGAIEAGKIAAGAITADNIAANSISGDKIAANSITSAKIVSNAITADKIVSDAITADKIATNAITSTKILAGSIDVLKLAAGTISVNNLESGDIKATSFIRAGTAGAARVEISSATVGTVLPGLTIYGTNGSTQVLRADLSGGLSITGNFTATTIATSSNKFSVDSNGIMDAKDATFTGTITANGGNIGGIYIMSSALQNNTVESSSTFKLDSGGKARFGGYSSNSIIINPSAASTGSTDADKSYIFHSADGGATSSGKFRVATDGTLYATSAVITGSITANAVSTPNATITSGGVLSATGANISGTITADSGSIGGFNITAITDIEARTADRPRILFGSKIHIGWDDDYTYANNYYAVKVGNPFSTATSRFLVNTKDNVFRVSVDTSAASYAMEVRNGLRARDLIYITSLTGPTSSRRFKENITYAPSTYYERILNLNPAFFTYKDNEDVLPEIRGVHSFGLIAEDLEEAGLGYFVERDMEGKPKNLLNIHELPQLLIPIVKSLKEEVSSLKNRIQVLESN